MTAFAPLQVDAVLNIVNDPISAVLALIGALLVAVPSLLLGYMTVRGLVAGFVPESGQGPPRQQR